jgi:ubiquinone/menaquinone biosynthesis C-methylase UbiE
VREAWSARTEIWDRPGRAAATDLSDAALLDALGIRPGLRVLDLASGAGNPSVEIARRMGVGGFIVASDLVPEMVARSRQRVAAAGNDNVRFAAADIQALPFRDESFDAVVCRLGIMFCPAIETALAEVRRVLAPGGIAAFSVWGPREDNTVFLILESVVSRASGTPEFTPLRFGEPDSLRRLLALAAFRNVEERSFVSDYVVPREEAFWRQSLTLHYGAWLDSLPARARTALEETVESAFAGYRTEEGYRLRSHIRICSGAKP